MIEPSSGVRVVHRPGGDGLFGSTALCGATVATADPLVMHEWEYGCRECGRLSGEATRAPSDSAICADCGAAKWNDVCDDCGAQ